jgi:hypothetical protein
VAGRHLRSRAEELIHPDHAVHHAHQQETGRTGDAPYHFPYLTYVLSHVRDPRVTLLTPDEYAEQHPRDVTRIG